MTANILDRAFAHGHASANDWREALDRCLEQCRMPVSGATLGFVYASEHFANDLDAIRAQLVVKTGVTHWTGTVGVGICANGKEYFGRPALAVMLCDIGEGHFTVLPSLHSLRETELAVVSVGAGTPNFAVVHGDPATPELAPMIKALAGKLESGFVVGGLTSSRGACPRVPNGERPGLSGVVFSGDVVVATRLTQGCAPIGPRRTITRAQRNILITIDGRPALDVLREDLGGPSASLDSVQYHVFAGLPVKTSDTEDYLVRHLIGTDSARGLVAIADTVETGASVFFCTRDKASASDDLERMLRSIKSGLYRVPKGALYYSCLGRGPNLFGGDSQELRIIRDHLGEVPLVGFFGNGEISHDRLYGYTGVLTLFL
ncbi:MAG: FIST C-terminal domain-containing protein [Burkholderiales bacterium]